MHVGYTIQSAAAESGIEKIGVLYTINQHATQSSMENIYQTQEIPLMDNMYASTVIYE